MVFRRLGFLCLFFTCCRPIFSQNLLKDETSKKYAYKSNKFQYTEFSNFVNGFAFVNKGKKYAFVNTHGDTLCPFEYNLVQSFNEIGLSLVGKDSLWGLIDSLNQVLLPFQYQEAYFETPNCVSLFNGQYWQIAEISSQGIEFSGIYKKKPFVKNGLLHTYFERQGIWQIQDLASFFSSVHHNKP